MSTEIESLSDDSLGELEEAGNNLLVTETQLESKNEESQDIPVADCIVVSRSVQRTDPNKEQPSVVPGSVTREERVETTSAASPAPDILTVPSTEGETDGGQSQDLYGSLTEGEGDNSVKRSIESLNISINRSPAKDRSQKQTYTDTAAAAADASRMSDPSTSQSQPQSPELQIKFAPLVTPQAESGSGDSNRSKGATASTISQPLATQDILYPCSQTALPTLPTAATQFELSVPATDSDSQLQPQPPAPPERPTETSPAVTGGLIIPSNSPTYSPPHSPDKVNTSQQSVFVQLKTSPKKRPITELISDDEEVPSAQRLKPESKADMPSIGFLSAVIPEDESPPSVSGQAADTQPCSLSRKSESQSSNNSEKSDVVSPLKPPRKRVRQCIESPDPYQFTSQDPNLLDSQELPTICSQHPRVKTKETSDGKLIQYTNTTKRQVTLIEYRNEKNEVVYKEYQDLCSPNSAHSSGYMGDKSSGSSSTTSQNSAAKHLAVSTAAELILKTHRSAEDALFISPSLPGSRHRNISAPPQPKPKPTEPAPLPKPDNLKKVLVAQQARSILASVNGHVKCRSDSKAATRTPPSANTTLPNLSGISAIEGTSGLKNVTFEAFDTDPPSENSLSENTSLKKQPSKGCFASPNPALPTTRRAAPKIIRKKRRRTRRCSSPGDSISPPAPCVRSARNLPTPRKGELVTAARVVAKWPSDSHYYFGHVANKAYVDKWSILFDDGNTTNVSRKDILVIDSLPVGYSILCRLDKEYLPALVSKHIGESDQYEIKFTEDQTLHQVEAIDICLDSAQFRNLQIHQSAQKSTESEGDRLSDYLSKHSIKTSTPTPLKKTIAHTTTTAIGSTLKREKIFTDLQRSPDKRRPKPPESKPDAGASTSRGLEFSETCTGSLDIFQGFVFMVTSLNKDRLVEKVMIQQELTDRTETESPSQATDVCEEEAAIDKGDICAKIAQLGGIFIDKFDHETVLQATKCFLISATFQRTVKYLQCLAANIPPVSYQWVEHCYKKRQLRPYKDFLLPAGVDIMNGKVIEWQEGDRGSPLKDVTIFIAGQTGSSFVEDWKTILSAAGALIVKKMSGVSGIKPRYMLVSNEGCVRAQRNQASRLSVPAVSPEWAIQQLISGIQLSFDYHPSFAATDKDLP